MPWEFHSQMRPTVQPAMVYAIEKGIKFIGIKSPYKTTLILRILSMLACFASLLVMYRLLKKRFQNISKYALLFFVFGIWFFPFISARFSSETWSGLFTLIAVCCLYDSSESKKSLLISSFFLGLAFLFRYQAAIIIFFIFTWLVFIKKTSLKTIALISIPIIPIS